MSRATAKETPQTLIPINRWFVWKEVRQLLPLIVALVLAAAAVLLIQSEMFTFWARVSPLTVLVFPGLFAVGAGTVLVGQERDQRTMDWLTTLPIPNRYLVLVKIYVALVGLALMWCLALLTITVTGIGQGDTNLLTFDRGRVTTNNFSPLISYSMWIVYSVYVMLCSFLASWRIKNPFLSIVAIVPLACLPLILCELILESLYQGTGQQLRISATIWVRLVVLLISVPAIWSLTCRTAFAFLAPQSGPKYRVIIKRLTSVEQQSPQVISQAPKFGSQVTSIIWQSIHSAPLLWTALFAMMMLGIYLPMSELSAGIRFHSWYRLEFLVFLSPLAVSWLGVSVFKNDGSPSRLQFLSDRGISPGKIFVGRHAIPIAIIACGLIAYTLAATHQSTHRTPNDGAEGLPSLLAMTLVVAVIYSASQWASQLIRMVVVAAIIAPIVSTIVLSWWSTAAGLGAPIWMLAAFAAMPMLATWRMMQRYMDMRDRPRSFLLGVAVAVAMFALPVAPQMWGLAMLIRSGEIPIFAEIGPLRAEGLAAIENAPDTIRLHVSYFNETKSAVDVNVDEILLEQALERWNARATTPDEFLPKLSELRDQQATAATIPEETWRALFARLMLEQVKYTESPGSHRPKLVNKFGSWVEAASLIAERLRRSPKWFDQEVADRLEVWLVETMSRSELAAHRDAQFFVVAAARFPDAQVRQAARRAGVLGSWMSWSYPAPDERQSLGLNRDPLVDRLAEGYYTLGFGITAGDLETIGMVAVETLRDSDASGKRNSWERRMHDAVFRDRLPFELGPYAPRFRDLPSIAAVEGTIRYPARSWGLAWEDEAEALKRAASQIDSSIQAGGDDQ